MVGAGVEALLEGPRGRGLCIAVAQRLDQRVRTGWLHAGWRPGPETRSDLLRALAAVDPAPVRGWADPSAFLEPVQEAVGAAAYWQPPDPGDVVLADPAVRGALRPFAEAIAAAQGTGWWSTPVDLDALRWTGSFDTEPPDPPQLSGTTDRLHRWRERTLADDTDAARNRPADPAAAWGGQWWSTPAFAAVDTSRALPGLGSVQLVWQEDSLGHRDAAVRPLRITRPVRVHEIDSPQAWVRLVAAYPLPVSNARRHEWYQATGRVGAWHIPDWAAVAADFDAVHVSVAGYLATAGRPLPLPGGQVATMLAGCDPDQTWWLTDVLAFQTTAPETWHNHPCTSGPDWRPTRS